MRASGYKRAELNYYVEPRWAIDALLDVEPFDGLSWDPSCGGGNIPRAMMERGLSCMASDIVDRGFGQVASFYDAQPTGIDNIVTNPPFGDIEGYIVRALSVARHKVAILARLALLEGVKRQQMFRQTPLCRVWVSSRRMSMPPGGMGIEPKGGSIPFAWFVWDHAHVGPATIGWIPASP